MPTDPMPAGKNDDRSAGPVLSPLFLSLAAVYLLVLLIDGMRVYLYCDEISFLKNVAGFFIYRTVEPAYTNYPTFYSYILALPVYLVYTVYYLFFLHYPLPGLFDPRLFALVYQVDIHIWMWVGRAISMALAVGVLALVYRYCAARLARPALLAALFLLAASPYGFYMEHARYALPDILVALLVTAVLYLASRYLERPDDDRSLYWAAFLAGLAASAKLNGALALVPLLVIPFLVQKGMGHKFRLWGLTAFWAVFGFFLGSPCNILKPWVYSGGFGEESQILFGQGYNLDPSWLFLALWREDPVATVLVLAALAFSLWRHAKKDLLFLALLVSSVLVIGGLSKRMPHYLLFLWPWVCVVVGEFCHELIKGAAARPAWLRWLLVAALLGVAAFEGHRLAARLIQDSRPDNRDIAREWMKENISPDEHILLDVDHVPNITFQDLVIMPQEEYIGKNKYKQIVQIYAGREPFHNVQTLPHHRTPVKELRAQGSKYLVTSNSCFLWYLRDPAGLDWVEHGPNKNFVYYLTRRNFYLQLFRENAGVKVFRDGSGPEVYLFRLL